MAEIAVWGLVKSVSYNERSFVFQPLCLLRDLTGQFSKTFKNIIVKIAQNVDGCFNIDDSLTGTDSTPILIFLDSNFNMVAKETLASEQELIDFYSSSCSSSVFTYSNSNNNNSSNQCQPGKDRTVECLKGVLVGNSSQPIIETVQVVDVFCDQFKIDDRIDEIVNRSDLIVRAHLRELFSMTQPPTKQQHANNVDILFTLNFDNLCTLTNEHPGDDDDHDDDVERAVTVLAKNSILVDSLHFGSQYVLFARATHSSPWPNVTYELVASPFSFSYDLWDSLKMNGTNQLGSKCNEHPIATKPTVPTGIDNIGSYCPGQSDNLNDRINPYYSPLVTAWFKVDRVEKENIEKEEGMPNERYKTFRMAAPIGQHAEFRYLIQLEPLCQLTGEVDYFLIESQRMAYCKIFEFY